MRWIYWILAVLVTTGSALAQEMTAEAPGRAGQDKSTIIQWLIAAVFLVGAMVVAFKPAKRAKLE